MKKVLILKGLSGSGKTTYVNSLIKKHTGVYKNICKDDLRTMFDANKYTKGNESFILKTRDILIIKALEEGYNPIISDTNLNPIHEAQIRKIVKEYCKETAQQVQISIKFFNVPVKECIANDLKRLNSVGSSIILKQYNKYLKPKVSRIQKVLKQDNTLPKCIICDIDGTVALNTGGRSPFDGSRVNEDTPNKQIVGIIKEYLSNKEHHVVFLSGREGNRECYSLTHKWLKEFIVDENKDDYRLLMRKEDDNRKDYIIKKELFEKFIKDKLYVSFVLDDRIQVCRMWHELGLTLLRVGDPDADF